ncbi:hypothetical protein GJC41_18735 [Salmonella enterica]|nr:hypothetical protein [Salmonella enterica]ELD4018790.1 hypothetical protein [Salmonella enterica]
MTADEIARNFGLHIHTARLFIHAIMRRADGTRCRLEGRYAHSSGSTQMRLVKYFSVLSLPDSLSRSRSERDGRE